MKLQNKTVLVTGASQGIGAATIKTFAKAGYHVVLNYFQSTENSEQIIKECLSFGVKASAIQVDCREEKNIAMLAEKVASKFGPLDILVNNFGNAMETEFTNATQKDMLDALNATLVSAMLATRIFVPKYMQQKASVLNVASIYGLDHGGSTSLPLYSAGKAGLINFTQVMAKVYAPNIRFNAVAPGFTRTPHWESVDPARSKQLINTTLLKEWIESEDVAKTLLFLAELPHINAETIVVDAGWSKR